MQYHLRVEKGFMPEIQARINTQKSSPFLHGCRPGVNDETQPGITHRCSG
ncbi:hypothetical protein H4687_000162 [Streptomyces stelliscabiei]|uniref:Uncharacterized protein n=1 Tax=Streptomyces stelliscabiei TaxID=146820 RepID=A0A8I0P252_9ACTN|nr:hypothetical protein [Streptomyces stelliscabiei]